VETGRAHVGDVVGDDFHVGLLGLHPCGRYVKGPHVFSFLGMIGVEVMFFSCEKNQKTFVPKSLRRFGLWPARESSMERKISFCPASAKKS
jgi:hypothetical protein